MKGSKPMSQRFADDQGLAIGGNDRTVREVESRRGDTRGAVRIYQHQLGRFLCAAGKEVEPKIADVRAAASIHYHVIAVVRGKLTDISVDSELAGRVAQQFAIGH